MQIFLKEKKIFLTILTLCLVLPNFIPLNVSLQLLLNSTACVGLACLLTIIISDYKRQETDTEEDEIMMKDALKFPMYASISLGTLYILFKNIDKNFLNFAFKFAISIFGLEMLAQFIQPYIRFFIPQLPEKDEVIVNKKINLGFDKINLYITKKNLVCYALATFVTIGYIKTNHWTFNNIFGIVFSITGIMYTKVSDLKTIMILLWLLFVYDIIMVFKSDLMVTVAKNLDIPIKLSLPYKGKFSILGLGDIVVPGILVAWALKYDVDNALQAMNKNKNENKKFEIKKPFFWATLVGYLLGIVSTFVGMTLMEHAQPALLYLIPWTTICVLGQGIAQGQFMKLWKYQALPKVKSDQ